MDPFTQGALGGAFSQSFANKAKIPVAALAGVLGGLAPDLDVVISSATDPLLGIEFHRHFTHSIFFIPFGGLLVAAAMWLVFTKLCRVKEWGFKTLAVFATLGYATHAALDACTSYGTRLFWPISNARVTWDTISIIDPIATIPLIIFVLVAYFNRSPKISRIGFGIFLFYISLGFIQNARVSSIVEELATSRGHEIERIKLNPTLGNLIVWRSVYEYDGNYYVDAVTASPFRDSEIFNGPSVKKIDAETIFPEIASNSRMRNDIRRFDYFTESYLFMYDDNTIGDLRYSAEPHKAQPIWGIEVDPTNDQNHVKWVSLRGPSGRALDTTWAMLKGEYSQQEENLAP